MGGSILNDIGKDIFNELQPINESIYIPNEDNDIDDRILLYGIGKGCGMEDGRGSLFGIYEQGFFRMRDR